MGYDQDKQTWLLLEIAARLELTVANEGQVTTYRRPGYGASISDVTFTTDGLSPRVERWRVFEGYTASDHQYIVFSIKGKVQTRPRTPQTSVGWNLKKLDADKLTTQLDRERDPTTASWEGKRLRD